MIRDFSLADFLTLGNAASGMAAIFAAISYVETTELRDLYAAIALGPLAFLFDALDGRVARWRHKHSAMGRELDSLADVISFGVAPAAIGYAAGLRGGWDRVALVVFVVCGVSRLARYNVTAETLSAGADKVRYFEGAPIPTSLWLTGLLAIVAATGRLHGLLWFGAHEVGPFVLHPLALLFAAQGALMVSKTMRIPKL
ncbi:MAG: CDP-alcohol phosphatidyltransferase [Myxococcales bacterium]|nr:CDP-alcohol phosphatidyltransferase [Myxococcales bacterium]